MAHYIAVPLINSVGNRGEEIIQPIKSVDWSLADRTAKQERAQPYTSQRSNDWKQTQKE
jgi:hypothetical protein